MPLDFQQTDDAPICPVNPYCSGLTANAQGMSFLSLDGGTPGVTQKTITVDFLASNRRAIYIGCTVDAGVSWSAGTWVVRFNLTASDMNCTWQSVHICRVNSGCTNQASIGSASSLGISLGSTGVKSTNVTGTAQVPAAGDRIMIICGVSNSADHGNQTIGITPDQIITAPFDADFRGNVMMVA